MTVASPDRQRFRTADRKQGMAAPEREDRPDDFGVRAARSPSRSRAFTAAEIADLVDDLARDAEAVCRRYLSRGRRQGGYWCVGDLANTPGRSLYVRLQAGAKGAAGKWIDEATGQHGDLLDIIRETSGLRSFPEVVAEARRFLGQPEATPQRLRSLRTERSSPADPDPADLLPVDPAIPSTTVAAARRLFAASPPIAGTLAETYLRRRGITGFAGLEALRFHPRCFYRTDEESDGAQHPSAAGDGATANAPLARTGHRFLPALIAAVTDETGAITGVQRTWLDADVLRSDAPLGPLLGKAPVPSPRRALGDLSGRGVHFGSPADVVRCGTFLVGEGLETVLSLRMALPSLPSVAALSAGNLGALPFPRDLRRLYIAEDADPPGRAAASRLRARAEAAGVEAVVLSPALDDFNGDLCRFGVAALAAHLRPQLAPEDVRFLLPAG